MVSLKKLYIGKTKILYYSTVASTNTLALNNSELTHGDVVLADRQDGGRGRMGRSFFSPTGGLYMSVVLDPNEICCTLPLCTASAAVAVRGVLTDEGISGLSVKWVNDILKDRKKVAGILTEASSFGGKTERVVVGIGINLQPPEGGFPDDIKERAGDVGYTGDKLTLAARIAETLCDTVKKSRAEVAEEYSAALGMIGERVTARDYTRPDETVVGKVLGVDENCFLKIQTDSGEVLTLSSGEIN